MKTNSSMAAALLLVGAEAQSTIYSGTGFGTYYYGVEQVEACGTDFQYQNEGDVECSYFTALTLDQINFGLPGRHEPHAARGGPRPVLREKGYRLRKRGRVRPAPLHRGRL